MNESDDLLPRLPAMERAGQTLRVCAPAKINLNLLVGSRRADGFHSLDSLVAQVTLYDELELVARDDGMIVFSCRGADCGNDDKNLALRAGRLLHDETRSKQGAEIRLVKHIPPGKGLGGGSSDAAAVLRGLSELWYGSRVPADMLRLLGAQLGSDVPLFLGTPTARMTGRGEILHPAGIHPFVAVLILPQEATSTPAVYKAFDELAAGRAADASNLSARQVDFDGVADSSPSRWRHLLQNDLFAPACKVCPALAELQSKLSALAALPVCLTGSGSAMFILCDDLAEARAATAKLPPDVPAVLVQNL